MNKQQQHSKQSQSETFRDANDGLVISDDVKEVLGSDDVDLHNNEKLKEQSGEPDDFVQVAQIYTDRDSEPINPILTDADKRRIAGFNSALYQQELDKEKYAKICYMVWQSKQLYYTAFRLIGWDEENKKVEWEQRDYKYHKLSNEQKLQLKKDEGAIKTLETKNNLWKNGIVSEALYNDMINREEDIDTEIEIMKNNLLKKKFSYYFLEDNDQILNDIGFTDLRDLVEAAEYRETGVPFSRKLASYRTTSELGTVKNKLRS